MEGKRDLKKLVQKAMRGSAPAFERLIKEFGANILYLASQELDDQAEVEDVAQEVVLVLYRNIAKLKSPHAFYSYLQQTVHYVCMERNRKTRRTKTEDLDEYIERQVDQLPEKLVSRDEEAFSEGAGEVPEAGEMAALLAELPPRQRETLYLYYYQGLSYKEIAQLQGISVNTVGVNISKAKASLRKMM